jgi:hypothetical protein
MMPSPPIQQPSHARHSGWLGQHSRRLLQVDKSARNDTALIATPTTALRAPSADAPSYGLRQSWDQALPTMSAIWSNHYEFYRPCAGFRMPAVTTLDTLGRPASEKRQGTKSREERTLMH